MKDNFEACLRHTLRYEGGYVDHPADPGGATNLGITRRTLAAWRGRTVSKAEVRALSREEAAKIYRKNYWDAVRGDELPAGVDAAAFDHAVNSGPRAAIRLLQRALGINADGVFGVATLAAIKRSGARTLIPEMIRRRRSFLARLRTFRIFGRGWSARMTATEKVALALAGNSAGLSRLAQVSTREGDTA